ncbi:hypothetical protein CVT25_004196 [Psilocybe cyanescens]|uniref:Uncharacterized protein n=1 Tax=Psilocybe cyanescens TaxID=93625 RepID=A0A409X357_PSICY|nr:hypothetical protein CVT25_004196 [Psilocybe cyanescens]
MQTQLPVEIIQHIVDELGTSACEASSREALRSLARVSTTICMHAYKHLFGELNLILFVGMPDDCALIPACKRMMERLQDILAEGVNFPGLAMVYYLRTVSLTILCENQLQLHQSSFVPELSGLFQALHGPNYGITTFRLEISQPSTGVLDNPQPVLVSESKPFGSTSYAALLSLWRSPGLTTLQLAGTLLPSTALYGTDLQNLYLQRVTFQEEPLSQVNHLAPSGIPHPPIMTVVPGQSQWAKRFFEPVSYGDTGKMTSQPLSFTHLTSLAVSVEDYHTDLSFFPQLQSLKVIMNKETLTSTTRSLPRMLQGFLFPPGRGARNLGSVENFTLECTKYGHKEFRISDLEAHHPQRVVFTSVCNGIDSHLVSIIQLRHIYFSFILDISIGKYMPESEDDAFMAANMIVMAELFPRLYTSDKSRFSLDLSIERQNNALCESKTTVQCKGPMTGWW